MSDLNNPYAEHRAWLGRSVATGRQPIVYHCIGGSFMTFSSWVSWFLSVIVTGVNWLKSATLLNVPLLYILLGIIVMGVVIRAILFRA